MHREPSTHISHQVRHFGLVLPQASESPIGLMSDFRDSGFSRMGLVAEWVQRFPACILTPPKPPPLSFSTYPSRSGAPVHHFMVSGFGLAASWVAVPLTQTPFHIHQGPPCSHFP